MNKIFVPKKVDFNTISPITLAFYGDAVHTLWIRNYFLNKGLETSNNLHKISSSFCSATSQAEILDILMPKLTEEELSLVRRTRNSKTHKPPKSCDLEIYKKSTSFEALVGLLMIKNSERLEGLLTNAMEIKEKKC